MSSGRIAQHRNYDDIMVRHKRYLRIRHVVIALAYVVVLVILLVMYFMVKRLEKQKVNNKPTSEVVHQTSRGGREEQSRQAQSSVARM